MAYSIGLRIRLGDLMTNYEIWFSAKDSSYTLIPSDHPQKLTMPSILLGEDAERVHEFEAEDDEAARQIYQAYLNPCY